MLGRKHRSGSALLLGVWPEGLDCSSDVETLPPSFTARRPLLGTPKESAARFRRDTEIRPVVPAPSASRLATLATFSSSSIARLS
jgi:hypothetical protein